MLTVFKLYYLALDLCVSCYVSLDTLRRSKGRYTAPTIDRACRVVSRFRRNIKGALQKNLSGRTTRLRKKGRYHYDADVRVFLREYHNDGLFKCRPGRDHRGFEGFINDRYLSAPGKLRARLLTHQARMDWLQLSRGVDQVEEDSTDDSDNDSENGASDSSSSDDESA